MVETFKDRLITEKSELDTKIEKLNSFVDSPNYQGIGSDQQALLSIQLKAMETYSQCLLVRLARL